MFFHRGSLFNNSLKKRIIRASFLKPGILLTCMKYNQVGDLELNYSNWVMILFRIGDNVYVKPGH
jgi:hypothetical protein